MHSVLANARPPTPPSSSTHPRPSRRPLGYTRACFRSCVGPSLPLRVTSQPGFGHASWQGVLWPTSCQRRSQAPFGVLGRVLRHERGFPGARRARGREGADLARARTQARKDGERRSDSRRRSAPGRLDADPACFTAPTAYPAARRKSRPATFRATFTRRILIAAMTHLTARRR